MGNKINFLDAGLDEIMYRVPDYAKVTITPNKFNSPDKGSQNGTVFLYLGQNDENHASVYLEFFHKVIAAINLDPDETLRLDFNKIGNIHFHQLIKNYPIHHLICFGVSPSQIGLHIEAQQYVFLNVKGVSILFADRIDQLTLELKRRLWKQLQDEYQLK